MQSPAPHHRPRPSHWVITAAALAAVVVGASLVGPRDDTSAATAPASASAPDPRAAHYPFDCGAAAVQVVRRATADLDHDGRAETAAVVHCASGGGTPPSGLYVLGPGAAGEGRPRVLATLVDPAERMTVAAFRVTGDVVSATLLGYSSASVPRCCPDRSRNVEWRWRDGKFELTALPVAGSV
ncbi:hypothetical protein [Streptomyces sp. UNOC14_S4]|uniref:hypothetical protein n=1 Tax=Streptomyces sp. UNOC14_S4 TaxID=2872340 RepID=UPI001E2EC4FE|nr:hypothetical protein [Streptomyces sp. UNOC14_S4]MCC3768540.1 hypothetical protein [Streptomyces sp. UNOC14_S4]